MHTGTACAYFTLDKQILAAFIWNVKIILLSLQRLHTEASLVGGVDEGGDLYIGKSVILRFVLDVQESGSSRRLSNYKATMTLMGM